MAITPEIRQETPGITQVPENVDLGPKAQEAGVEQVPSTPTSIPQQAQANQPAQPLVVPVPSPPAPTGPSITIPSDPVSLQTTAKGDTSNSVTWLAVYWLRMVKKALNKHWNIIIGGNTKSA